MAAWAEIPSPMSSGWAHVPPPRRKWSNKSFSAHIPRPEEFAASGKAYSKGVFSCCLMWDISNCRERTAEASSTVSHLLGLVFDLCRRAPDSANGSVRSMSMSGIPGSFGAPCALSIQEAGSGGPKLEEPELASQKDQASGALTPAQI